MESGGWWMGLNVSFGDPEWWHGRSTVPYRGWVLRVSPDGTVIGKAQYICDSKLPK